MRGQIEFGETLMVVIVIVFLLTIGIVFYYNVSKGSIEKELGYREDVAAVVLGKRVLALPEIRCDAFQGEGCIDAWKLVMLARVVSEDANARLYYGSLFGYSTIRVEPLDSSVPNQTLYTDRPTREHDARQQYIFTTLYDPLSDTMTLAVLNVTRYAVRP